MLIGNKEGGLEQESGYYMFAVVSGLESVVRTQAAIATK